MSKYTQQFKLEVVQEFLKSGGLKKVAHIYQINHSDVRKWVLAYQAHGPDGLSHQRQNFTPEFKLKVLMHMAKHQISARPATAIFNIGDMATVLRWQKLYNEGGIAALQIKPKGGTSMPQPFDIKKLLKKPLSELTPSEMRRRLEYLEAENAYLKKLDALAQSKVATQKKSK